MSPAKMGKYVEDKNFIGKNMQDIQTIPLSTTGVNSENMLNLPIVKNANRFKPPKVHYIPRGLAEKIASQKNLKRKNSGSNY